MKLKSIHVPTFLINAKICHTSSVQAETIVLKPRLSFIIELNAFISSSVYLNTKIIMDQLEVYEPLTRYYWCHPDSPILPWEDLHKKHG